MDGQPKKKNKTDSTEKCGKCDSNLKARQKAVQCSTCSTKFHTSCQDISDAKYEFLTSENNGIMWFCYICRKTTSGIINKLANIEIRLQKIETEREKQHTAVKDLNQLVHQLQEKCKAMEDKIQHLSDGKQLGIESNERLLRTITGLRRDLYNEHNKNLNLQSRLDDLDQRQREKNVRVMGLSEQDDTNIKSKLIKLVGARDITENDICCSTRMGKQKDGISRDLLVQFVSKEKRDEFYSMRKRTPKNEQNKKVFINEDLTELRAKLFYDARRLVRRNKLFGTWSQNGNIMIKVMENDNPCVIRNHQELRSKIRYVAFDSESIEDMEEVMSMTMGSDFIESNSDLSE